MITESNSKVTFRRLKPAVFVSFRYRTKEGEITNREMLQLHYDEEKELLHGLDLEEVKDKTLVLVSRQIAKRSQDREDFERRLDENDQVYLPNIQESELERWYDQNYKPSIFDEPPYRTFRKEGVRNLRYIKVFVENYESI